MNYHDPSRTKLANWRPCWLDSPIALPSFQLEPHPTDPSLAVLTICHGTRGVWLSKDIPLSSLIETFHFWTEDPEGTFMDIFGLEDWPRQVSRWAHVPSVREPKEPTLHTPMSIEELI